MASAKQIAANRRNAQSSTGPKSKTGKDISRRNALKHGLTAETVVIGGEDPAEFETLRDRLFQEYCPCTAVEVELTQRLAGLFWRLKRVPAFEAALFEIQREHAQEVHLCPQCLRTQGQRDHLAYLGKMLSRHLETDESEVEQSPDEAETDESNEREEVDEEEASKEQFALLGHTLIDGTNTLDALAKLSRYEAGLAHAAERIINQLERQKQKRADKTRQKGNVIEIKPNRTTD